MRMFAIGIKKSSAARWRALSAAAVVVLGLMVPSTTAHAADGAERTTAVGPAVHHTMPSDGDPVKYWTRKRMAEAKPAETDTVTADAGGDDGAGDVGEPAPYSDEDMYWGEKDDAMPLTDLSRPLLGEDEDGNPVYAVVGRLYYEFRGHDPKDETKEAVNKYHCTASLVNTSVGRLLVTAGHCTWAGWGDLYDEKPDGGKEKDLDFLDGDDHWAQNMVFVPGYGTKDEGPAIKVVDLWCQRTFYYNAGTGKGWEDDRANHYDYGVAVLDKPDSGQKPTDIYGAMGMRAGGEYKASKMKSWKADIYGYPHVLNHRNEKLDAVLGASISATTTTPGLLNNRAMTRYITKDPWNADGKGASGGPWVEREGEGTGGLNGYGYIRGVTSQLDGGNITSPYLGVNFQRIINEANDYHKYD